MQNKLRTVLAVRDEKEGEREGGRGVCVCFTIDRAFKLRDGNGEKSNPIARSARHKSE